MVLEGGGWPSAAMYGVELLVPNHEGRSGCGFGFRERFDCRIERLVERPCPVGVIPDGARLQRGEQNAFFVEAEIRRLQVLDASDEQPAHHEQDDGARNLRGRQARPDQLPLPALGGRLPLGKIVPRIDSRRPERRDESNQERAHHHQQAEVAHDRPVELNIEEQGEAGAGGNRGERAGQGYPGEGTSRRPEQGDDERFDRAQSNQIRSAGAERAADGHLPSATESLREEEAQHVRAGD